MEGRNLGPAERGEGLGNENTFVEQLWLERLVSECLISHGGKGHTS